MPQQINKEFRLFFWTKDGDGVSKFASSIVPRIGERWRVPRGSHNYNFEQGAVYVKVLEVEIELSFDEHTTDVYIECEITEHLRPDIVKLSPKGFER